MAIKITHLDNFREVYTLNFKNEKRSDNNRRLDDGNAMKILMWVPIISNIMAVMLFKVVVHEKAPISEKIAYISRGVIGFIAAPLLIPIDLIGTVVKCIIDERNKRKAEHETRR